MPLREKEVPVPESKGRDKPTYTPPRSANRPTQQPNPRWYAPVMVTLMVLGLLWVATYYISGCTNIRCPRSAAGTSAPVSR